MSAGALGWPSAANRAANAGGRQAPSLVSFTTLALRGGRLGQHDIGAVHLTCIRPFDLLSVMYEEASTAMLDTPAAQVKCQRSTDGGAPARVTGLGRPPSLGAGCPGMLRAPAVQWIDTVNAGEPAGHAAMPVWVVRGGLRHQLVRAGQSPG
jgi:hypothetical protein